MAFCRLEKIGTIYSRITGLIKAEAMKLESRPLWYEVYQAFPPEQEPRFDRTISSTNIRKIFYPEDVIRAKFYTKMSRFLPVLNLSDAKNLAVSQKFIQLCLQIQKEKGIPLEDTFESAFDEFKDSFVQETPKQDVKDERTKGPESSTILKRNDLAKILEDT